MISNSPASRPPLPDAGELKADTGLPAGEPSQAPRRRGRPSAGGREAILEAALTLLRERGIARVTSREVAALAGVSEASVFYHYKDRAGLLQAVFEQGLQPLSDLAKRGMLSGADLHEC